MGLQVYTLPFFFFKEGMNGKPLVATCHIFFFFMSNLITPNLFRPHMFLNCQFPTHTRTAHSLPEFLKMLQVTSYQKGSGQSALLYLNKVDSCLTACCKAARQTNLYNPRTINFKLGRVEIYLH